MVEICYGLRRRIEFYTFILLEQVDPVAIRDHRNMRMTISLQDSHARWRNQTAAGSTCGA